MNTLSPTSVETRSRHAMRTVLEMVLREGHPLVLVQSPPGAGKTDLSEAVGATAVSHARLRVAVVTPRVEQSYDFARRFLTDYGRIPFHYLASHDRTPPDDVRRLLAGRIARHALALPSGPSLVVSTAAKLFVEFPRLGGDAFDLLICDEAYQLAYKDFAPLLAVARQKLLVGDPGQLDPFVRAETARFEAAAYKVHWAVPRELRRRFPGVPTVQLPATRRFPQDTVELLQPSFYPELPFVSAIRADDRRLRYGSRGFGNPIDRALDLLANGATVVALLLPARQFPTEVDEEVAGLAADVVRRALDRQLGWEGKRRLGPSDIGCVDAHVASGAAIRRHLQAHGISADQTKVDDPEIWQGLQRPLMIVKHPLSGELSLSGFSLAPGRFCVMLSRHMLGCIIVGRDGIDDTLERYLHDCGERPIGADDDTWAGWQAHSTLWRALRSMNRVLSF